MDWNCICFRCSNVTHDFNRCLNYVTHSVIICADITYTHTCIYIMYCIYSRMYTQLQCIDLHNSIDDLWLIVSTGSWGSKQFFQYHGGKNTDVLQIIKQQISPTHKVALQGVTEKLVFYDIWTDLDEFLVTGKSKLLFSSFTFITITCLKDHRSLISLNNRWACIFLLFLKDAKGYPPRN